MKTILKVIDDDEKISTSHQNLDWLWENQGKHRIISVPFRHGSHMARNIPDLMPILRHLEHIHDKVMVHG